MQEIYFQRTASYTFGVNEKYGLLFINNPPNKLIIPNINSVLIITICLVIADRLL